MPTNPFTDEDKRRVSELLERNRAGTLTDVERDELDIFVKVGDLIAILQSKARKRLKASR